MKLPFTPLIESLPSTVPFVGPELQERTNGFPFKARIGANENVFGASPKAHAAIAKRRSPGAGNTLTRALLNLKISHFRTPQCSA